MLRTLRTVQLGTPKITVRPDGSREMVDNIDHVATITSTLKLTLMVWPKQPSICDGPYNSHQIRFKSIFILFLFDMIFIVVLIYLQASYAVRLKGFDQFMTRVSDNFRGTVSLSLAVWPCRQNKTWTAVKRTITKSMVG